MHRAIKAELTLSLDELVRRIRDAGSGEFSWDEVGRLAFACERFAFAYRAHQLLESYKMDSDDAQVLNKANPVGLSEPLKIHEGRFGTN